MDNVAKSRAVRVGTVLKKCLIAGILFSVLVAGWYFCRPTMVLELPNGKGASATLDNTQRSPTDWSASQSALYECRNEVKRAGNVRLIISTEYAVCFVGTFTLGTEDQIIERLDDKKILVVKSFGGSGISAARLGMSILALKTRVVVMDYCLSACANWVFLPATTKVVPDGSIVGWHGVPSEPNAREKLLDHNGMSTMTFASAREVFDRSDFDWRLACGPDRSNPAYKLWSSRIKPDGMSYWTWSPSRLESEFRVRGIIYFWYPEDRAQLESIYNGLGINVLID